MKRKRRGGKQDATDVDVILDGFGDCLRSVDEPDFVVVCEFRRRKRRVQSLIRVQEGRRRRKAEPWKLIEKNCVGISGNTPSSFFRYNVSLLESFPLASMAAQRT